jgi:8-oxo-dGTP pyrophosphatase MutT (NUDIX family)
MTALAPPHVTVVYPEEFGDEDLLWSRAAGAARGCPPARLRLGPVDALDGGAGGVFVRVDDVDGVLTELRDESLLPPFRHPDLPFHVTLVHPRTSKQGPACWAELRGRRLDVGTTCDTLLLTETGPSGRTVLRRAALAGAAPAGLVRMVGVVPVRDGCVLLGYRRADRASYPAVWDVVGGHVEPGERLRSAARREASEELGVDVEPGAPAGRLTSAALGVELTLFRALEWRGEPRNAAPEEHDRLAWWSPSELSGAPLAHPGYAEMLRRVVAGERFLVTE